MIRLPAAARRALVAHCRAAYPEEACGLLLGRRDGEGFVVTRAVESANLAADPRHRFEVDPALRLRLQRAARAGDAAVIGHYHSHPDGAARPSATDLAEAWEPELVWLVAALAAQGPVTLAAHLPDPVGGGFRAIPLYVEGEEAP